MGGRYSKQFSCLHRGKAGVDGLLNMLEWFTVRRGLDKVLYEGKIGRLSEAMLKLIPPTVFDASTGVQRVTMEQGPIIMQTLGVTNHAQPLCTDIPHYCARTFLRP